MASTVSTSSLHLLPSTTISRSIPPPAVIALRRRVARLVVRATATAIPTIEKADVETVHRLKNRYFEKIVPALSEEFGYTNVHEVRDSLAYYVIRDSTLNVDIRNSLTVLVPKLEKIVVNCGMGDASQNKKGLESVIGELACITGQKPVKTMAKNAVANFKIREGQTVGVMITLRKNLMYSFLDRLINLALPRVRDFQGVNPNSFDGNGNFSMGFREQSVFPEISYDAFGTQRGMDVCISTTAGTDKEAYRLLALMGMPFKEGTTGPTVAPKKKKKRFDPKKGKGGG